MEVAYGEPVERGERVEYAEELGRGDAGGMAMGRMW